MNLKEASSPHVVSGLMKLYLRELPEPLFTFGLYDTFIAVCGMSYLIIHICFWANIHISKKNKIP